MDSLPTEARLSAALLMACCVVVKSELSCDQTEFFHPNGTCVACLVCGPGEQLSEDCGFGDGGAGVCIVCEEGKFSADTGVAPCMRCTQCNLLNRLQQTACVQTSDARCGRCLPGHYELRSLTGEAELPCVPCYSHDTVHKECLTAKSSKGGGAVTAVRESFKQPRERRVKEDTFSMVLIGSATASSVFLVALLLWVFLLAAERFSDLQASSTTEGSAKQSETLGPAQEPLRGHDNEVHPTSIVINVTTNIKPSEQKEESVAQERQESSCSTGEMEQQLQTIWEVAQGQSIEMLDYDSVQDLSLLLDSADNRSILRRLGRTLGVPPHVNAHLQGFQDLFQYLRTSTYTLLPQLAQAAALLPDPEVVARIHRAVVNK